MRSSKLASIVLLAAFSFACSTARDVESAAAARCSGCHGFPPESTAALSHPASTSCHLCHSTTADASGDLVAGGTHANGRVDLSTHAVPFAGHQGAALADLRACAVCHGAAYDGGEAGVSCNACHESRVGAGYPDWQTNCTFCHGTRMQSWTLADAAPPPGARGETATSDRAVGAHDRHLGNGSTISNGVACTECHAVPLVSNSLAHVDGTAALTFGALATRGGAAPEYARASATCSGTYCHGATLAGGSNPSPTWTGSAGCGTCHGLPPPTGRHLYPMHAGVLCVQCHAGVADGTTFTIRDDAAARALHVNGTKDVQFPESGTWDAAYKTCSDVVCHRVAPPTRYW